MILSTCLIAITSFLPVGSDSVGVNDTIAVPVVHETQWFTQPKPLPPPIRKEGSNLPPEPPEEPASQVHTFPAITTAPLLDTSYFDTSKYLDPKKFTWAGQQRYILDGSPPMRVTELRPATLYALGGAYFGVLIALHIYQENTFWRQSTSFRVRDNYDESLGANYGGHMAGGYFVSYISTEFLLASGVSTKLAPIYGALMGLGYQTYVEVLDGFGLIFEFSPYETYAQTLGVIYYLASQFSPFLQNFFPKFNYYPSSWFGSLPKAGSQTPIDDYSAWNFWISVNIPNLTNGALKPVWPDWLHLALGYGARNLDQPGEARIVTLALDYDLVKLLPDGSPTWNWFKQTLNFFKLPSPTVEWRFDRVGWKSQGPAKFYLLYPFQILKLTF